MLSEMTIFFPSDDMQFVYIDWIIHHWIDILVCMPNFKCRML